MGSNSSPSLYIDASEFEGLAATPIHSIFEGIPSLAFDFSSLGEFCEVGRICFPHVSCVM